MGMYQSNEVDKMKEYNKKTQNISEVDFQYEDILERVKEILKKRSVRQLTLFYTFFVYINPPKEFNFKGIYVYG